MFEFSEKYLFRSFCTSMHASQLWSDFTKAYTHRLRVHALQLRLQSSVQSAVASEC